MPRKIKPFQYKGRYPSENVLEEGRDGGPWMPRAHVPGRPRTKPKGLRPELRIPSPKWRNMVLSSVSHPNAPYRVFLAEQDEPVSKRMSA